MERELTRQPASPGIRPGEAMRALAGRQGKAVPVLSQETEADALG